MTMTPNLLILVGDALESAFWLGWLGTSEALAASERSYRDGCVPFGELHPSTASPAVVETFSCMCRRARWNKAAQAA